METTKGIIKAVCLSDKKGIPKKNIGKGFFKKNWGLVGDAHSGTKRQVSILKIESIKNSKIKFGDFAENLTIEGLNNRIEIGTKLKAGNDVILQVTEIGKECHTGCAISKTVGVCIMPKEGIFAKVIKSGWIKVGDSIEKIE